MFVIFFVCGYTPDEWKSASFLAKTFTTKNLVNFILASYFLNVDYEVVLEKGVNVQEKLLQDFKSKELKRFTEVQLGRKNFFQMYTFHKRGMLPLLDVVLKVDKIYVHDPFIARHTRCLKGYLTKLLEDNFRQNRDFYQKVGIGTEEDFVRLVYEILEYNIRAKHAVYFDIEELAKDTENLLLVACSQEKGILRERSFAQHALQYLFCAFNQQPLSNNFFNAYQLYVIPAFEHSAFLFYKSDDQLARVWNHYFGRKPVRNTSR